MTKGKKTNIWKGILTYSHFSVSKRVSAEPNIIELNSILKHETSMFVEAI